jgi:hypothetical protein
MTYRSVEHAAFIFTAEKQAAQRKRRKEEQRLNKINKDLKDQ